MAIPSAPEQVRFSLHGDVRPLAKAEGVDGWTPTRPLGGWLATYGKIAADGSVQPTSDRDGHTFEAAGEIGRIDFSPYLRKGKWDASAGEGEGDWTGIWDDTHTHVHVGLPSILEFHGADSPLAKAHGKVGWWAEGHLFDRADPRSWTMVGDYEPTAADLQKADYFWGLAAHIGDTPRPLGFSAGGKMLLSPCGTRIIWARVSKLAVCEMPRNPDSTAMRLSTADKIHANMVGRSPCDDCRCPPGAKCDARPNQPMAKAATATATEQENVPDLVDALRSRYNISIATAARWLWRARQRGTTKQPKQEQA